MPALVPQSDLMNQSFFAMLGADLDPKFPIILGVILICLILLRSYFRKKK